MLRPYKLVYSKIHKVNSFINHVMLDVIFRAPKIADVSFSSALIQAKYRPLIDGVNKEYVLTPLSEAFQICKGLDPKQLKLLKRGVHVNNKIRELCDGHYNPVSYSDIEKINVDLEKALKKFNYEMYDKVLGLAPCYNNYELVDAYYKQMQGRSSSCRCCGINKVLTKFHSHRSALDHYLPRKHYPFSSINFKNLFPICDICNNKYKLSEDPLFLIENGKMTDQQRKRVKAFYPFRRNTLEIGITIVLKKGTKITELQPENIDMSLNCTGYEEQVSTWDRVFGIQENYKAECCTEEMLTHYEEQYIGYMNYGKTHDEYIDLLTGNKYGDSNFLKIPFLNAVKSF